MYLPPDPRGRECVFAIRLYSSPPDFHEFHHAASVAHPLLTTAAASPIDFFSCHESVAQLFLDNRRPFINQREQHATHHCA